MTKMHCEFERLQNEHIVLMMEYGRIQRRVSQIIAEQAAEIRRLEAEVMTLRAPRPGPNSEQYVVPMTMSATVVTTSS